LAVRQFHHVKEISCAITAADLQDVHQAVVRTGDWLELEQALEFALEMFGALEALAVDNFHRAQGADGIARQPDFAVSAVPDLTKQFMIGNLRRCYDRRRAWIWGLAFGWHDDFPTTTQIRRHARIFTLRANGGTFSAELRSGRV
jgi:hypothetical protein